jgi:hypothetical protein
MVLTYDDYNETIENAQQKDDEIKTNMKDQNQINNFAQHLFDSRIIKSP